MSIQSGDIVWVSGLWQAGSYPDIPIFLLSGLKEKLLETSKRAGYCGEPLVIDLPHKGPSRCPSHMIWAKKGQECVMKRATSVLRIGAV